MQRDYTRICRVCMSEGSRDIFPRNLTDPTLGNATTDGRNATTTNCTSTSPLDRLLEKLRYVTMMKIDENDDLPRLLCDLCIVQLNVAYNFKRQAVENDTKLRQYFIENGISPNQYVGPRVMAGSESIRSSCGSTPLPIHQHPTSRNIPIMPPVKCEVTEMDILSDATESLSNCNTDNPINSSNNANNASSMVFICSTNSVTPSSDIEYISNPLPTRKESKTLRKNIESKKDCMRKEKVNDELKCRNPCSTSQNEDGPRKRKTKAQSTSTDLVDKKVPMHEPKEIKRLLIDSKFRPSDAPRQARLKTPIPGRAQKMPPCYTNKQREKSQVSNLNKKSEKKCKPWDLIQKKTRKCETPRKNQDNEKILNPFTQEFSAGDKLLKKIKNIRVKRSSEKVCQPKINPPTTKKSTKFVISQ